MIIAELIPPLGIAFGITPLKTQISFFVIHTFSLL